MFCFDFPWSNENLANGVTIVKYFVFHYLYASTYSFLDTLSIFGDLGGNSVHIGGTLLGEHLSENVTISFIGDLSDESGSFQLLESISDGFTSGNSGVLSSGTSSLFLTIVFSEGVDSNLSSHVELIGNGGSSNVKPVWVIRSEILETSGFIVDGPLYYIILN